MCKMLAVYSLEFELNKYDCKQVRTLFPEWKEAFKKSNRCGEEDRKYKDYFKEIEDYLETCVCIH